MMGVLNGKLFGWLMAKIRLFLVIVTVAGATACADGSTLGSVGSLIGALTGTSEPDDADKRTIAYISLIDGSGSQASKELAACVQAAAAAIDQARAGDILQVRMIGERSYSADLLISDLRVPAPPQVGTYDLSVDPAALQQKWQSGVDSARAREHRRLAALSSRKAEQETEIWGALGAAAETLARATTTVRVISVCSDLDDTMGDELPVELSGIFVVLRPSLGRADAASDLLARRNEWTRALRERGALNVIALPPGEALDLDVMRTWVRDSIALKVPAK